MYNTFIVSGPPSQNECLVICSARNFGAPSMYSTFIVSDPPSQNECPIICSARNWGSKSIFLHQTLQHRDFRGCFGVVVVLYFKHRTYNYSINGHRALISPKLETWIIILGRREDHQVVEVHFKCEFSCCVELAHDVTMDLLPWACQGGNIQPIIISDNIPIPSQPPYSCGCKTSTNNQALLATCLLAMIFKPHPHLLVQAPVNGSYQHWLHPLAITSQTEAVLASRSSLLVTHILQWSMTADHFWRSMTPIYRLWMDLFIHLTKIIMHPQFGELFIQKVDLVKYFIYQNIIYEYMNEHTHTHTKSKKIVVYLYY